MSAAFDAERVAHILSGGQALVEVKLLRCRGNYLSGPYNKWIISPCPFCHRRHEHGATDEEVEKGYPAVVGQRISHCGKYDGGYDFYWDGKVAKR